MNTTPALLLAVLLHAALPLAAQVPQIINYQGKVAVGSTPFTGSGQFRFALVDGTGATSYWSNDGTSTAGSQPTAAVSLPVVNGLYVVPLGDATIPNMTAVPATVFTNADVRLRVWFNDGTNGSQQLSPDQRITSVGYAMVANTVPDGAITTAKVAAEAITTAKLAAAARPKFDRQKAVFLGSMTLTGTPTDVPGLTLTTKSLGEAGTYKITFSGYFTGASTGGAYLNIGGIDEYGGQILALNGSTATSSTLVFNVPAGTVIKLKAYNFSGGNFQIGQLILDGVPTSQVLP